MNWILSKYISKFYFKKWIFGICRVDIKEIIKSKTFDPDINWFFDKSFDRFYADPFLLVSKDGNINIILEDCKFDDKYGKIALITIDKNFRQLKHKILLDTKSHLSYPFVFTENNKTYVFPEASESGKLPCYEYDPVHETLNFLKNILDLPLLDSTILKHENKYWIFGTIAEKAKDYKLYIFFSENLLGPYTPHLNNPVASGLNGSRSAGNFILVDGIIYRPTQNCKEMYGESITVNKVTELNEINFVEEPYMNICINRKNKHNYGMRTIHTINVMDNIITVDGKRWTFSPLNQLKKYCNKYF